MHHRDDNDLFTFNPIVDAEREPMSQSTLGITMNRRVQGRQGREPIQSYQNFVDKFMAQPIRLIFVPSRSFLDVLFRFRS